MANEDATITVKARALADELKVCHNQARADWADIDRAAFRNAAGIVAGSLALGEPKALLPALVGLGATVVDSRWKRHLFRRRVTMSVFVDLERRTRG